MPLCVNIEQALVIVIVWNRHLSLQDACGNSVTCILHNHSILQEAFARPIFMSVALRNSLVNSTLESIRQFLSAWLMTDITSRRLDRPGPIDHYVNLTWRVMMLHGLQAVIMSLLLEHAMLLVQKYWWAIQYMLNSFAVFLQTTMAFPEDNMSKELFIACAWLQTAWTFWHIHHLTALSWLDLICMSHEGWGSVDCKCISANAHLQLQQCLNEQAQGNYLSIWPLPEKLL